MDAQRPGKPVVAVILQDTKVTDSGLNDLKDLNSLRALDLSGTNVTDAGLKELKGLITLRGCRP